MISKISLLLFLSNLVFIQGISNCCNGTNVITNKRICADGSSAKHLDCETSYIVAISELPNIIFAANNSLIDDQYVVPPNRYCMTTMQTKNDEVFIICIEEEEEMIGYNEPSKVNTILQIISVIFIFFTVFIYFWVPITLDLQDICLLHSITGLALGCLMLIIINFSSELPDGTCHALAYIGYFFFMYSFFWQNVVSFHIWKMVMNLKIFEGITHWKIIYHLYGIGSPLLAVFWLMLVNLGDFESLKSIHPGMGHYICWFKSARESMIYFYCPFAVLLAFNMIFLICTTIVLWKSSRNCPKSKVVKYRLKMYFKLFFIMGFTWIFEILSTLFENSSMSWLWVITDIFNALQGLVIFLILVVFRKKIKRALANRKICSWRLPVSWKEDKDSECEELEETEYSLQQTKVPF